MSERPSITNPSSIYKKLSPDGTLDMRQFIQVDYDLVVKYIKKSFPKATTLQRDIDQTLKRTFVLGNTEPKAKSFHLKSSGSDCPKQSTNRKLRLKKERKVPRKLPYTKFEHLNNLWNSYVTDLLQDTKQPEDIQSKLNRVDLHGALIVVSQAHCKDFLGLRGIVIKETKNTLVIVTIESTTKTIPKTENVFDIQLANPEGTVKIAGNSFITRPAERASKKVKSFIEFVGVRKYKSQLRYGC